MTESIATLAQWQTFLAHIPALEVEDCDGDDLAAVFTPEEYETVLSEAHLRGFQLYGDARDVALFIGCEAGRYLMHRRYRSGAFDGCLSHAAWELFGAKISWMCVAPRWRFPGDGIQYMIFPDRSLFIASNAEDEVWISVGDFYIEKLFRREKTWSQADYRLVEWHIVH